MADETAAGSSGTSHRGRHPPSSGTVGSPLQTRAQFLKNWDWNAVTSINRGACERGGAQHGTNPETEKESSKFWEELRLREITLAETYDSLRQFHKKAPFLFFNGNTFSTIGRELTFALFSDLPPARKREAGSVVAHYIAGVLDREFMVEVVEGVSTSESFSAGDFVKTLRGSLRGQIVRILDDGRVVWKPLTSPNELVALPETLIRDNKPR